MITNVVRSRNQTISWGGGLAFAALVHIARYAIELREGFPVSGRSRVDEEIEGILRPASLYHGRSRSNKQMVVRIHICVRYSQP